MCGIAAVMRKDGRPAAKSVIKRFHAQSGRGTQGFGYIAIKDGKVVSYERAQFEHEIMSKLRNETATEIYFHHRYPTGSPNLAELAHPIFISHPTFKFEYFILHNGVIRNTDVLKTKHEKAGYEYSTEVERAFRLRNGKFYTLEKSTVWNDSESLAWEVALALENEQQYIGTTGAAAVIAIQVKGTKVIGRYFFRNEVNPLKYMDNPHMTALTSLGKGEMVKTDRVKKLFTTGLTEDTNIYVPLSYTRTYEGSGYQGNAPIVVTPKPSSSVATMPPPPWNDTIRDWDREDGIDRFLGKKNSGKRNFGFVRTDKHASGQAEVIFRGDIVDLSESIVHQLDDMSLFSEISRTAEGIGNLSHGLEQLESDIIKRPYADDIAPNIAKLHRRLESLKKYKEILEVEANRRGTIKLLT